MTIGELDLRKVNAKLRYLHHEWKTKIKYAYTELERQAYSDAADEIQDLRRVSQDCLG